MKTKTTFRAVVLVLATLFIAACGNKGDLFLTEKPAAVAPAANQTPETATEEKKK